MTVRVVGGTYKNARVHAFVSAGIVGTNVRKYNVRIHTIRKGNKKNPILVRLFHFHKKNGS